MWPITRNFPKPPLPISGRPAIDYIDDKLFDIDVETIFVSTNFRVEQQFQTWLVQKISDKIVTMAERSACENAVRGIAELAHQVKNDDYVIVAGDNLFTDNLKPIVAFYRRVRKSAVAIFDVEDLDRARRGSTVSLYYDMRIVSFEEKPTRPIGRIIMEGLEERTP